MSEVELLPVETEQALPKVLPLWWHRNHAPFDNAFVDDSGLCVIVSSEKVDDKRWLHVSMSRCDKLPSWEDVVCVKRLFVGRKRKAIQVLPGDDEYINHHPNVLHLWSCLDSDPLPDFRRHGTL